MDINPHPLQASNNEDENLLTLSLSTPSPSAQPPSSSSSSLMPPPISSPMGQQQTIQLCIPIPQAPPLPYYPNHQVQTPTGFNAIDSNTVSGAIVNHSRPSRSRRNPFQAPRQGRSETIPPPFPWATNRRATVHTLDYLVSHNLTSIYGDVQCKKCDKVCKVEYDLQEKFKEIRDFIKENKFALHDRAPSEWTTPTLPSCETCGGTLKPVLKKKRDINWLFLLLGKMLGCCKLSELKYFCKHTKNHRTGAKDRVLYLTYMGLCKQLDPNGPCDV
ncbi:hypothetical protein E1A91_D04G138300v1 [Gossypium mustelinum]|uniref:DUF7086 domain-containing protein n=3 Tax=Gossypium TaxID=3633 RepID=A0A7J9JVT6_9ROSI|nr:hypothetical protein [Gossypium armourianum]TYI87481.1 hypothetical protein E1A91_D04G138300v1 [Gossypium mustelinum]